MNLSAEKPQLCTGSRAVKRRMRRGMRISADQPPGVRAVQASQFSSHSQLVVTPFGVSREMPSAITPATFTAKNAAVRPSRRLSTLNQTQSLSESRSRRVSRPTTGVWVCEQSNPRYSATSSYSSRKVVASDGGAPPFGPCCVTAEPPAACAHTVSSGLPSSTGVVVTRAALKSRGTGDEGTGAGGFSAATAPPLARAVTTTPTSNRPDATAPQPYRGAAAVRKNQAPGRHPDASESALATSSAAGAPATRTEDGDDTEGQAAGPGQLAGTGRGALAAALHDAVRRAGAHRRAAPAAGRLVAARPLRARGPAAAGVAAAGRARAAAAGDDGASARALSAAA